MDIHMFTEDHSPGIKREIINHLDDLLREILEKKGKKKASWSDDENGIFFRCQQYERRYSDHHKLQDESCFLHSYHMAELVHLLRNSILSHQWADAIKVIHTLAKESSMTEIIWKAGMTSLFMEKNTKAADLYSRQLCDCPKVTRIEVFYEYLLYLLTEGNLEKARSLTQDIVEAEEMQTADTDYLRLLFRAYMGLIDYIHWKIEISQGDEEEESSVVDFISSQLSQGLSHRTSKLKAEKAIHNLSCVRDMPGVWDIFIVKIVEMHEFYNELEAAKSVLRDYISKNPDNLNAHRYLYKYEMKHKENTDEKLQSMKNIIHLDPSNSLALELYRELESSDPGAVAILFDYLDFNHCKNDIQAWSFLKTHLEKVGKKKQSCQEAVSKCWVPRKDWWPNSTLLVDHNSFEKLVELKKQVHNELKKYSTPKKH